MSIFVGRQREMAELNAVLAREGAHFLLVYGRRQVGKTTLVLRWAQETDQPVIYWVAPRDTPAQLRHGFTQNLWGWAHPGSRAVPRFDTWDEVFETAANLIGNKPVILILDQFSYAIESDAALPSKLQAAWDRLLKNRNVVLMLVGSNVGTMLDLVDYEAPLYGRITRQLPVDPLAFPFVSDFLPEYSAVDRLTTYAVTGGVPAYLERFDATQTVGENVQRLFLSRTGMFRNEPFILIGEVIRRETRTYEAILKAIAAGRRTPQKIGAALGLVSSYLSPYLKQLEALRLVERRIPATVPLEHRQASRISQYHVADPYLHFHFRFIAPHLSLVEQDLAGPLWQRIEGDLDAFVGETAFRNLCREWLMLQARAGELPFLPEIMGSHWGPEADVDLVAINWQEQAVLLAECRWDTEAVGPSVIAGLIGKAPHVVPGDGWQVNYTVFARAGFSEAAREMAAEQGVQLVDLATMDADLRTAFVPVEEEEEEGEAEEGESEGGAAQTDKPQGE
jgi:AAA+ ATPase superfamily predicted ATPase